MEVIIISRFIAICLVLCFVFALFGCNTKGESQTSNIAPNGPESSVMNPPQTSKPQSSQISDSSSNAANSASSSRYFTDIMPPLTADEELLIDEPVSEQIFNDFMDFIFVLPNVSTKKLTYGELWRYTGIDGKVELEGGRCGQQFSYLKSVDKLYIRIDGYSEDFPVEDIAKMTWLTELHIIGGGARGGIKELPASFSNLENLRQLNLNANYLNSIPDIFDNMPNLEYLNLNYNKLSVLPPSLFKLNNLKVLNLGQNPLSSIPDEICGLINLEVLILNGMMPAYQKGGYIEDSSVLAKALPKNIGDLINLRELSIEFLSITELPESITNLEKLEKLRIFLPLKSFPDDFEKLKSIENMSIIIMQDDLMEQENGSVQKQVDEVIS